MQSFRRPFQTLLPAEVLTNIFLLCLQDDRPNTPLILSHVCSSWRKIALRTPKLWSHLHLSFKDIPTLPSSSPFAQLSPPPKVRDSTSVANLASLWFERGRHHLQSVSIHLTATDVGAVTDLSSALGPILSNATFIRHLSINLATNKQLETFLSSTDADFLNLEYLSLSIKRFQGRERAAPVTVFRNASSLRKISLDLNGHPPITSFLDLPWDCIQEFNTSGSNILPSNEFRALLKICTNLRHASCWVEDSTVHFNDEEKPCPITLPRLSSLSISFYGREEKTATSLFHGFSFPNLQDLRFFSGFITVPFLPTLNDHDLRTLVLSGVSLPAPDFTKFAANNSTLRSLTIDLRYLQEDVGQLLRSLSSPRLLPNLTNLTLWTRDVYPYTSDFTRLIKRRSKYILVTPLKLSLNLARPQHGVCCFFSRIGSACERLSSRMGLDDILSLVDTCKVNKGVELHISDVRLDQGITMV